MNFVKQIVDELSGDALGKLSSLLGTDDETAETAVSAAAPSLLAGLANLVTQSDGTRKLSSALSGFGDSSWGNFSELLSGDANSLMQKGGGLLNNLFSATLLNGLSNSIAKFAGINSGTARNLLAYIAPMILGKVAAIWRSRGGDASALTSFLAEQKENIVDAMPAGFSLAELPGMARFSDAARNTAHAAGRRAESASTSAAGWLVPLAILLGAAFLLWTYMQPRREADQAARDAERTTALKPVVPEAPALPESNAATTALTDSLRGVVDSAKTTLTSITNEATAEQARPELEALKTKLDTSLELLRGLPQIAQNTVRTFVADRLGPIKAEIERVGRLPMAEDVKALIMEIVKKFQQLSGELELAP